MKKVLAWLLVIAMTAALAVGGTLAYLTDADEDVNVMTLGKVKIDQLEYERQDVETENADAGVQEFHDNKPLLPAVTDKDFNYETGDSYVDWEQIGKDEYTSEIWDPSKINNEVDKMVFVKNKGNYDAFVRTVFAFEAGNYTSLAEFQSKVHLNLNKTDWVWKWNAAPVEIGGAKYFVATATYNHTLTPGVLTEISLSQIALDSSATNADVEAFGDTYQVLVLSQGIQADGFTDADTALNEGFGTVPTAEGDYPFADDNPIQGIDLYSALHYVDGDTTATPITANVSKVVFGLNADHADITSSYTGTLVDVEQDVPVYAYYVKDGSNYQVYFLANDDIYLPKNCYGFFYHTDTSTGMTGLKSLDLSNTNTSRVENMSRMFRNCSALTSLDIKHWDVSNVTAMDRMFMNCSSLLELDLSGWDTGKVTTLDRAFFQASKLKRVNAAGWDTGNVTNLYAAFGYLPALEYVNLTGWDVRKVTDTYGMFMNDYALKTVEGSGDLAFISTTNTIGMFQSCKALTYLDVTNWNLGKVENMRSMFRNCHALTTLEGSGNWSCAKSTSMELMFYACYQLQSLDVTNWDVSNVTCFAHFLASPNQNAADMALKEIKGLENWRPEKCTTTNSMFYGCGQLLSANMSGWDVSNLVDMSHMFSDCHSLQSVDFTGWQTPKLNNLDALFNHCTSLKTVDMSMFDTSNVTVFAQVFEICSSLEEIKGLEN